MAMKILNQFIDDFVGVFQYRFMDTFQYFKERKKSKYLGDRFEEWVVKNSNISKEGYPDLCDKKIFWRLLDWRGDKYIEGYRPLSSSSPDLLMECVTTTSTIHEVGDIIAVECKWRSKIGFTRLFSTSKVSSLPPCIVVAALNTNRTRDFKIGREHV
mgnify:CR=1 FL=1